MADAANIKQVREFFDHPDRKLGLSEFKDDWGQMTEQDKTDIKNGIGDGSFDYPKR